MAYDDRRGLTMLYGDRSTDASRLWAWDGVRWQSFDAPGPGLRRHIKLAYDTARGRLVLYGGYDDAGLEIHSDTWEWDGQRWQQRARQGPGPRSSYSLIYDPIRERVIMFGGLAADGPKNDTWSWDGDHWEKVSDDGPSPRGEAGAVFEGTARRVVLSGGMAYDVAQLANGRATFALRRDRMPRDTWTWDGRNWRLLSDDGIARMAPLTADPISGGLLRIGGESEDGAYHGDLWRWTDQAWLQVEHAAVPARHGPAVALDTRRKRVVLFGGSAPGGGALADLWEWDGRRWRELTPRAPE